MDIDGPVGAQAEEMVVYAGREIDLANTCSYPGVTWASRTGAQGTVAVEVSGSSSKAVEGSR